MQTNAQSSESVGATLELLHREREDALRSKYITTGLIAKKVRKPKDNIIP